jgi:SAM-dependent methyltransferase
MVRTRDDLLRKVQARYGAIARAAGTGGCCGPSCGCGNPITSDLYPVDETRHLPADVITASLGCGNPTALTDLEPGQVVLDLGSGGGVDTLLSARRVAPTGKVYGLDMTDDMLALARANQRKAGVTNVEFLKGTIEAIPLPDNSIDVVVSNCVINLSPDKDAVIREAFRVLKPGGRFAVADIVALRVVPSEIRTSMELWVGCVAGALEESTYAAILARAGFRQISIDKWRIYRVDDARSFLAEGGIDVTTYAPLIDGALASAFIRASKPTVSACCDTRCCAA